MAEHLPTICPSCQEGVTLPIRGHYSCVRCKETVCKHMGENNYPYCPNCNPHPPGTPLRDRLKGVDGPNA